MSYLKACFFLVIILAGTVVLCTASPAAVLLNEGLDSARSVQAAEVKPAQQQVDQENPFEKRTEVDFYQAKGLLRDFKIISYVIFLVGGVIAVVFCRKYIHNRLPRVPVFSLMTAFVIQYVLLSVINIGLYILAVHYEWLGFNTLDKAVNDSGLWPEIQKTLSLGLGSFYVAHLIDVFLASLTIFAVLTVAIALTKGKAR